MLNVEQLLRAQLGSAGCSLDTCDGCGARTQRVNAALCHLWGTSWFQPLTMEVKLYKSGRRRQTSPRRRAQTARKRQFFQLLSRALVC